MSYQKKLESKIEAFQNGSTEVIKNSKKLFESGKKNEMLKAIGMLEAVSNILDYVSNHQFKE